jgi:hypothetical protein
MRRSLLSVFLPLASLVVTNTIQAQDRFAYAITDLTKEGINWTSLRRLDLQTGAYSDVLLNGTDTKTSVFDAVSKRQLELQPDNKWGNLLRIPFSNGVAAAAYDREHNRLYFTPMFVDQLRYVDLKTMKVYYLADQALSGTGNMHQDESKIITRMVIAPDGYGYAINNDGTSLIRFSTGKKPMIENLGTLVDAQTNGGVSIHNRCSAFGGDMISDDKGNLFILTAPNNVFKVNIENKVATYLGHINGLPATFTTNGAVVDGDGNLVISSAVDASSYFLVDTKSWNATAYQLAASVYKSSDLANGNYLSSSAKKADIPMITRAEEKFSKLISVYPNPVTANRLTVQFNKVPQGDYTVELTDVLGRSVMQQKVSINAEIQSQVLPLSETNSKGVYMVKVYDLEKQSVFTQKVVVQ